MTLSGPRIWLESSPTRLSSRPNTPSATPAPSASSCAGTSTAVSPRGSADERHADRIGYARGAAPLLYSAFLDRLARFVSAVGGGCAKSLVIVLVAAVLFALVMSLTFRTNNGYVDGDGEVCGDVCGVRGGGGTGVWFFISCEIDHWISRASVFEVSGNERSFRDSYSYSLLSTF